MRLRKKKKTNGLTYRLLYGAASAISGGILFYVFFFPLALMFMGEVTDPASDASTFKIICYILAVPSLFGICGFIFQEKMLEILTGWWGECGDSYKSNPGRMRL